jgi:hypothetical protein
MTPQGVEIILYMFQGSPISQDGEDPNSLVMGVDGAL